MVADFDPLLIASLAAGLVLVGIAYTMARRRVEREPPRIAPASTTPPMVEPSDTFDQSSVLDLARELFAAQSVSEVRSVIARRLPQLVGTERVWVSGHAGGERQLIVPARRDGHPARLMDEDFQEWTTLPLRAGRDIVGVIGLDTRSARSERTRRVVSQLAPFIGQALQNAHLIDCLREASLLDPLTGTATRREGLARLHAELKRAQRTGSSIAVMLLDLDRFKSINDRHGHATGDAVLRAVGHTLRSTLRASDIRCRWGGEEFLVALPDTDLTRAQIVANGLLRNLAATTVPTPQGPVGTTTSIGLTMTRAKEIDVEAIIQRADVALYRAKDAGRACVRVMPGDGQDPPRAHVAPARGGEGTPLPFPDRRNPNRTDRRRVPSGGRRSTDPQ
jgi:diguanylate cyclase (GGDEF)-like protein